MILPAFLEIIIRDKQVIKGSERLPEVITGYERELAGKITDHVSFCFPSKIHSK